MSSHVAPQDSGVRTSGLLHPVALVALVVWLANDYWLSRSYPGWITGKLTDAGVIVVLPLLIATLINLGLPASAHARVVDLVLVAIGIGFVLVKLLDPANDVLESVARVLYRRDDLAIERDPSDLIVLPLLAVSRWCYRTAKRRPGETS